jgi:Transposase DDE domain group 1
MIWLLKPDHPKATELAPAMDDSTGILPGLPSVKGKPVHVAFDGGQMTSDAGILLLAAVEQRLGIAERLADCIEDPHPRRQRVAVALDRLAQKAPDRRGGRRLGSGSAWTLIWE